MKRLSQYTNKELFKMPSEDKWKLMGECLYSVCKRNGEERDEEIQTYESSK